MFHVKHFYLVSRGLEMDNVHYCKDVESTW